MVFVSLKYDKIELVKNVHDFKALFLNPILLNCFLFIYYFCLVINPIGA